MADWGGTLESFMALSVYYQFLMPIPEYRRKEIVSKIKSEWPVWHVGVPDTDNLIKFYGDSLKGILWKDDCLIASVRGDKFYSLNPRTIIEVREC
jgi:Holliday junction resolvase RusA-like endonuclease